MAIDFSATRGAHDDSQSPIGKGWVQGVALVPIFGFFVMGFLRLSRSPASLQLRYLQTLLELGADQNSTVVFPLPVDIITPFLRSAFEPGGPAWQRDFPDHGGRDEHVSPLDRPDRG